MDAKMVEQVLINLVKNAMEAVSSQALRTVRLTVSRDRKEILISVEDSGTGVGLSFSQHVMRLHQGFIRVSSSPGKGSLFQLVFNGP